MKGPFLQRVGILFALFGVFLVQIAAGSESPNLGFFGILFALIGFMFGGAGVVREL